MAYGVPIKRISRTATSSGTASTVTVVTEDGHPFNVGDKVNLGGVLGGGAISFSQGQPFTVLTVSGTQYSNAGAIIAGYSSLTYSQAVGTGVPIAEGLGSVAIASATPQGNNSILLTTATPHNITDKWIEIQGVTQTSGSALISLINRKYSKDEVRTTSGTSFVITLRQPVYDWNPGGVALNWTAAIILGLNLTAVIYSDDGINTRTGQVGGAGVNNNWTPILKNRAEGSAVISSLRLVANSKGMDYPFRRLFDPGDTTRITNSAIKTPINISQAPSTWRSMLDSFVEIYGGVDAKKRRYYINVDGQFVYDLISDSKPATGNAPYSIVVASAGTPNANGSVSSVAPYSLEINWDHDTTKRALFTMSNNSGLPINDFVKYDSVDALGTTYTRNGAPYFDDVIDYPTGTSDKVISRQTGARSYFLERSAPVLSGSLTLRGNGTQSWNNLGFSSGYAAVTSPGSYSLNAVVAGRVSNVITVNTSDLHHFATGMQVVTTGFSGSAANFNGTFTVGTATSGTSFNFTSAGTGVTNYASLVTGDEVVTGYGLFVRTGIAPNQIVTVTMPARHGIASGATTIVTGLTGTAGSSMIGTVTATVVDDYSFTYPSTGTNGTATGFGTVSSITLVPRWEPGQWVDITADELGLSGLYRVEQVDWRLEPGSFQQVITITFNRRNAKLLTKLIKEAKK